MADEPDEQPLTSVLSTEPFLLDHPLKRIRRARVAVALFVLALLVVPAASAWIGYELGARRTNAQIAALNDARAAAHANLLAGQKANSAREESDRELICDVLQRMPPDPEINRDRMAYKCGPYLPPSSAGPQQTPGAVTPIPASSQPARSVPPPTPGHPTAAPAPPSHPTPTPAPRPMPSPSHLICVLGICLL